MNALGIRDYAARGFRGGAGERTASARRGRSPSIPVAGVFAGVAMGLNAVVTPALVPLILPWLDRLGRPSMSRALAGRRYERGSPANRGGRPLQARAVDRGTAGRAHPRGGARDGQSLRQQLPRPRRSTAEVVAAARDSAGDLRLRHGFGAFHLRRAGPAPRAWSARSPRIWTRTMRSCSPPVSTPMAACSSRCSTRTTRSFPTRSTTPRSSTACGSARRKRYRYANSDMDELETRLKEAAAGRASN